ncbi:hypothetical protein CYMTET_23429 [Cymbomonas tetramitiformis]|uniref:Uncharacterized protein n=1 Tax=Cymbomonas tetramitiformis TaxID=36881 RepID=A0AAE0FY76_9CHLO|nr:hypothetical protein CYMTET_23429 [Cymbomonas tetramitiformis]
MSSKDDSLSTPWWERRQGRDLSAEDRGFSYSTVQTVKCETVYDENTPIQKCQKVTRKFRQAVGRPAEEVETVTEDIQGGSPDPFAMPSLSGHPFLNDLERIFGDRGTPQRQEQRYPGGAEAAPPLDDFISDIAQTFRVIDSMARAMEDVQETLDGKRRTQGEERNGPGGLLEFFAPLLTDR